MNIKTEYIKIINNTTDKNNCIELRFYYDLGGYNYATHKEKPRGYYLAATPMERTIKDGLITEAFTAFTGVYELLEQCNRKSTKAQKNAEQKIEAYKSLILNYYANKYGYILEV